MFFSSCSVNNTVVESQVPNDSQINDSMPDEISSTEECSKSSISSAHPFTYSSMSSINGRSIDELNNLPNFSGKEVVLNRNDYVYKRDVQHYYDFEEHYRLSEDQNFFGFSVSPNEKYYAYYVLSYFKDKKNGLYIPYHDRYFEDSVPNLKKIQLLLSNNGEETQLYSMEDIGMYDIYGVETEWINNQYLIENNHVIHNIVTEERIVLPNPSSKWREGNIDTKQLFTEMLVDRLPEQNMLIPFLFHDKGDIVLCIYDLAAKQWKDDVVLIPTNIKQYFNLCAANWSQNSSILISYSMLNEYDTYTFCVKEYHINSQWLVDAFISSDNYENNLSPSYVNGNWAVFRSNNDYSFIIDLKKQEWRYCIEGYYIDDVAGNINMIRINKEYFDDKNDYVLDRYLYDFANNVCYILPFEEALFFELDGTPIEFTVDK